MPYQLDASHSHIGFAVKHMMISTVRGQFRRYTAELEIDEQDFTRSRFTGVIEVASIDTQEGQRDDHLRSGDFFDAEHHPTMTFKSSRIERKGDDYVVHGDLTIRGTTREVALDVEYAGTSKDPWGNMRTGFSATGTIDRKDFGLTWNAALETGGILVGEKIKLHLDIEAVKQEAAVAI